MAGRGLTVAQITGLIVTTRSISRRETLKIHILPIILAVMIKFFSKATFSSLLILLVLQIGYSTWESSLVIESVLNTHYHTYQCIASNSLGEDSLNISLHHKTIPDPPVNLEVSMKDYKTVQLKVRTFMSLLKFGP